MDMLRALILMIHLRFIDLPGVYEILLVELEVRIVRIWVLETVQHGRGRRNHGYGERLVLDSMEHKEILENLAPDFYIMLSGLVFFRHWGQRLLSGGGIRKMQQQQLQSLQHGK